MIYQTVKIHIKLKVMALLDIYVFLSFFFLFLSSSSSSLRRDVAISAEASNGRNAQPHIPNGLKSLRGFCKPQKSTPVHLT